MQSDIQYAIIRSKRFDRLLDGGKGPPVGYDVFEITGHTVIGDVVYLTIKNAGWVRDRTVLAQRVAQKPKA